MHHGWGYPIEVVKDFGGQAGPALIATWCILALCRHLRCERSWLEFFGLVLCAGWISILLEGAIARFLWWTERTSIPSPAIWVANEVGVRAVTRAASVRRVHDQL
jgi:hypothetical protein